MKLYLCGQKEFGAATLRMCLNAGHEIAGVCSPEFNESGSRRDRLTEAAALHQIPWLQSGTLHADRLPGGIDLIVAAHSHDFIGAATRRKARLGAIGYHPSLLPRHRGRDSIAWAVKMHDPIAGGTVYWLDDRIDAGPIAAQDWCWIRPGDTAQTLWRNALFDMGLRLLSLTLRGLAANRVVKIPQDEAVATWEPACNPPPVRRPDLPRLLAPGAKQEYDVVFDGVGYPWRCEPVAR